MLLHCTLVRAPLPGADTQPLELTVDIAAGTTGAELEAAVARRFGTAALFVAGVPLAAAGVVAGTLTQGAVLVEFPMASAAAGKVRRRGEPRQPALCLVVHTGAGAGSVFPLNRGIYRIGRTGTDIVIPDPEMSRAHARLEVSDTAITIVDLGSANGTLVDGHRKRTAVITTQTTIRCGNSFLSLFPGPPVLSRQDLAEAGSSVAEPLPVPIVQPQSNRATLVITAVVPLLLGVALALATGMWMFLAFSAMSGLAMLVPLFAARRERRDFRTALSETVRQDQIRRRRAAPPVAEVLSAGPAEASDAPWHPDDCHGTWLRVGQGEQQANIRFGPSGGNAPAPPAGPLPVTLDPAVLLTTVRGPSALRAAFMRSLLLQLAYVPRAACSTVVVHAGPEELPLAARFLPNTHLSCSAGNTRDLIDSSANSNTCHRILFLTSNADATTELVDYAVVRRWQVIHFLPAGANGASSDVQLNEHNALFTDTGGSKPVIADLVAPGVFDRAARARNTPVTPVPQAHSIPAVCSLEQILSVSPSAIGERWASAESTSGLCIPLGIAADGARSLDLETDGPHMLVAGTTGAGKSELLRSITASLALCYSPDRVTFFLVDFKGGSGLAPLTGLPHCVGLLTDLSPDELDRFLISLRAEVRRREHLLAAAGVPDVTGYRRTRQSADSPIPRLILIIDEFRMLVEDAPSALGELLRIAAIGRSLGLHLIMATQRPQGAITADIRANVTSRICLRVQSELESLDVINTGQAAGISISTPGRAFLSRGSERPEEFQAASLTPVGTDTGPVASARLAKEAAALDLIGTQAAAPTTRPTPASAVAPVVQAVSCSWSGLKGQPPRRPVAQSLPSELVFGKSWQKPRHAAPAPDSVADSAAAPGTGTLMVLLGVLDKPEEQRLAPLEWLPQTHGHLALVGSPALAGQSTILGIALGQLLGQPAESHVYLLDGLGTFDPYRAGGRLGAQAGVHELRRGVRILEKIHEVMTVRLSRPKGERGIMLVLMIAGWGAWASALRSGPLMWAEDVVQDIVRDGSNANISVIISGERELVTSRFFPALQNRLFCPAGSTEESRLAWPTMPRTAPITGRSVVFGPAALGDPSVCQLYTSGAAVPSCGTVLKKPLLPPFRVEPLPATLGAEFLSLLAAPERPKGSGAEAGDEKLVGRQGELVLGLGGDELDPVSIPFPPGSVLAVLGRPGSGRSSVVRSLPATNPHLQWIAPGPADNPPAFWAALHATVAEGSAHPGGICLIDDADRLPAATNQLLLDLQVRGFSVVVTAAYSQILFQRVPVAMAARGNGGGLLLAPLSLTDGDVFGTRFDVESAPPKGRAVLIANGRSSALQLPYLPDTGTGEKTVPARPGRNPLP